MSAIATRRRRRAIAALVTGMITVIALPAGLVVGANSMLNDKGGNNVAEEPTTQLPNTPVALLAITNSRNELASIAVVAIAPGGKGGTIVSLPIGGAAATTPGSPMRRIGDAFATGGMNALTSDVESLLDVTISQAQQVAAGELSELMQQSEPISVTLSDQVLDSDESGAVVVVLNTGTQEVPVDRVAAGLASMQSGIAESLRYDQVKELWTSYAAGAKPVPSQTTLLNPEVAVTGVVDVPTPSDVSGFFTALRGGKIDVWQLSKTRVSDPQRNPDSADLYEIDAGEIIVVMASVAPSARFIQAGMIGILLDTSITDVAIVKEGAVRISYLGGNVLVLRDLSNVNVTQTVIRYNDDSLLPELEEYASLLGPVIFEKATERIEGVDAQVVLGSDFEQYVKGNSVGAIEGNNE